MKNSKLYIYLIILLGSTLTVSSQNLLDILEAKHQDSIGTLTPTFKLTRIAIGHSTEVRQKNVLEVSAFNRFWNLPTPRSQSFAADKMSTRFSLEYGITNKLSIGIGATTFDKLFDGYLKYNLISQNNGIKPAPINVTVLQSGSYNSGAIPYQVTQGEFSDRFSFTTQLLLSRKISKEFSFQLAPTFVHKSLFLTADDPENFFAVGFGGRYKLGPHLSVVSEYYANINPVKSFDSYGPFALGVNWELGDVLLQFMLTNAVNMVEDTFITQTRNNFNFKNPNLNFGFNATYVIHFDNKLKKK